MQTLDNYYLQHDEDVSACLLGLRTIILKQDANITESLKYGMPFFSYKGKMFCYLWVKKNSKEPYIGFVEGKRMEHPDLIIEARKRMKILMIDKDKDLPLKKIQQLIKMAIALYISGAIPIKR